MIVEQEVTTINLAHTHHLCLTRGPDDLLCQSTCQWIKIRNYSVWLEIPRKKVTVPSFFHPQRTSCSDFQRWPLQNCYQSLVQVLVQYLLPQSKRSKEPFGTLKRAEKCGFLNYEVITKDWKRLHLHEIPAAVNLLPLSSVSSVLIFFHLKSALTALGTVRKQQQQRAVQSQRVQGISEK